MLIKKPARIIQQFSFWRLCGKVTALTPLEYTILSAPFGRFALTMGDITRLIRGTFETFVDARKGKTALCKDTGWPSFRIGDGQLRPSRGVAGRRVIGANLPCMLETFRRQPQGSPPHFPVDVV